jgi:hypothetical protein
MKILAPNEVEIKLDFTFPTPLGRTFPSFSQLGGFV